ncbi:MAG: cell division protein ZipA [Gammaproteobacteria bacterium]
MNELRWILLGVGLVLLVLIYFFSRRSTRDDSDLLPPTSSRQEPSLTSDEELSALPESSRLSDAEYSGDVDDVIGASSSSRFAPAEEPLVTASSDDAVATSGSEASPAVEPSPDSVVTEVPEKVIALHLMPKSGRMFDGLAFIGAVQAEGLAFGRFDIFHRYADPDAVGDSSPSQFSLANMIKPGTFNLRDIDSQQFKGASLFLVLPGPEDAVAAFADMVATGRRLAATLDGQLLDAQGTALSRQSASHLREDIINYQHGLSAPQAD